MWATILGIIVSSIVSVLLSDKIISALQLVLYKFGVKRDVSLSGIWLATFSMREGQDYLEVIELKQRFKRVTGKIVNDNRNYKRLQKYMSLNPLRLRANFTDNQYLTGFWFHPIEHNRHFGTFQLIYNSDEDTLEGIWVGFSNTTRTIDSGKWKWVRDKKH